MTPEVLAQIAEEANLAPSVHNTQPVRWQQDGASHLILSLDPGRRLSIGDPSGQDARLSGGAALLGTKFALWRRGFELRAAEIDGNRVRVALGDAPDTHPPSISLLEKRTSYRAGFAAADEQQRSKLSAAIQHRADATLIHDDTTIAALAERNDSASLSVMRNAAFRKELLSWLRLRPSHPDWRRDGLSAEALAMSKVEAMGAALALRRPIFEALAGLGLARKLLDEQTRTRSSTALVAFHRPAEEDRWLSGGAFYELWLRLTEAGFAAWPMAVLADDAEARADVARRAAIADDRTLISVLRVGPHPGMCQPEKARLSGRDLIREA